HRGAVMRWTGLMTGYVYLSAQSRYLRNTPSRSKLYSTSYLIVNASHPLGLNISCLANLIQGTASFARASVLPLRPHVVVFDLRNRKILLEVPAQFCALVNRGDQFSPG